jgi:hypothetical protein
LDKHYDRMSPLWDKQISGSESESDVAKFMNNETNSRFFGQTLQGRHMPTRAGVSSRQNVDTSRFPTICLSRSYRELLCCLIGMAQTYLNQHENRKSHLAARSCRDALVQEPSVHLGLLLVHPLGDVRVTCGALYPQNVRINKNTSYEAVIKLPGEMQIKGPVHTEPNHGLLHSSSPKNQDLCLCGGVQGAMRDDTAFTLGVLIHTFGLLNNKCL